MISKSKWFFGFIAVIMVIASTLVVVNCAPKKEVSPAKEAWPKALTWGGGAIGASSYLIGAYLGEKLYREHGITVTPIVGGGTVNIKRLAKGEMDFGYTSGENALEGFRGTGEFAPTKVPLRLMFNGHKCNYHLFVKEGAGIQSISDLRGKSLLLYAPNVYFVNVTKDLLQRHGILDTVKIIECTSVKDGCDGIRDGRAPVWWTICGAPTPAYVEMAISAPVKLIPYSKADIEYLVKKYPWLESTAIPAGIYKGTDVPTSTVASRSIYVCRPDLPEGFVYELLKYVFDEKNYPDFLKVHPTHVEVTLEASALKPAAAYHSGAVSYYKHREVWTKETDKVHKAFLAEIGEAK